MYYRWLDMHNYAIKVGTSVSRNNIGQENLGLIFGWAYTRGGLFTGLYGISLYRTSGFSIKSLERFVVHRLK